MIKDNIKKDNIKWYPYPQEKPRYGGDYSVYLIDKGEIHESVSVWIPQLNMFSAEANTIVVAWADSDQPLISSQLSQLLASSKLLEPYEEEI